MATHSSILAWKIPRTEQAWWATVHGVAKSQNWLSTHTCSQMEEMHVVGKGEGAMQNFYALERQITLPKSPRVHLPRSSLNPVLLGFHGGLII